MKMKIRKKDMYMGYNEKHVWRFLVGLSFLVVNGITSLHAQCVVAGTNFDTNSELCCPILTSDEDGWYDEDLDWDKLCKSDMFIGPEYANRKESEVYLLVVLAMI